MKEYLVTSFLLIAALNATPADAHSGDIIASPGVSAVIDVTDTLDLAEWTVPGAYQFTIDNTHPNTAEVYALHQSDGIYLRAEITDDSTAESDALVVYLDLSHDNGSATDDNDWGVQIQRNGQATMGPGNADPADWQSFSTFPGAEFGVSADSLTPLVPIWIVEMKIPTGALDADHTLDFSIDGGRIGILVQIFSAFDFGDLPEATYNQWPNNLLNTPINDDPSAWGNYEFDPATTFPDIELTDLRNNWNGPDHYTEISTTQQNQFEAEIANPGGTVLPDASDVRVNFYIAPIGIGAKWRRLDELTILENDCTNFSSSDWPATDFSGVPRSDVCTGDVPHPDIETHVGNITDIVSDTVEYTVNEGVARIGGEAATFTGGTNAYYDILQWSTIPDQNTIYGDPQLAHQCVKAEAIYPNDPNKSNNDRWRNMNFVCVPNFQAMVFEFVLGWDGFALYDPGLGKEMILNVDMRNMSEDWQFKLEGAEQVGEFTYKAQLVGHRNIPAKAMITPPAGVSLGKTLKENLIVPPKSGGQLRHLTINSGDAPVYVKIDGGSQLLISNFTLGAGDYQFVDLDGEAYLLPSSGPSGLSNRHLKRFLAEVQSESHQLLVPGAPLGALVGSFDNFKNGFFVGDGVQIDAPRDARFLALGINGVVGHFDQHAGRGFRVKVINQGRQRESAANLQAERAANDGSLQAAATRDKPPYLGTPINEVVPTICLSGYENIDQMRVLNNEKHQLLRYIGDVCWGVVNLFPPERPERPDIGDVFEDEQLPHRPWWCRILFFQRRCR